MGPLHHLLVSRDLSQTEIDKSYDLAAYGGDIFLIIFSSLVLIARIWSRLCAHRDRLWYDDWFALAAWPFSTTFCILLALQFNGTTATSHAAGQATYASNACFYMGMMLIKTSALFFYARVFSIQRSLIVSLWVVGTINFLVGMSFTFAASFWCYPARKVWDQELPGTCGDITLIYLLGALFNALTDIAILIIPLFPLSHLQTRKSKKTLVTAVFLLGYGCPLLSIIKVGYVGHEYAGHKSTSKSDFIAPLVLTMTETPLAIVTTCLPALFALFKHVHHFGPGSLFRSLNSSEARSLGVNARTDRSDSTRMPQAERFESPSSSGEDQESVELQNMKSDNPRTFSYSEPYTVRH